jgi:hypothetical protein
MGAQQAPMGQGGQNVFNQSANAYNAALQGTQRAGMGPNINQFMNPYNQEVINRSMGDIGRAQQIAMNQLGAQASQAGAFGGSRQGVAEALTNEGFIKQMADTAAGLRQQGYGQALGAAQNQQDIGLRAASQMGSLAQTGFGFGQSLANQQAQQGGTMQGLNQLLIDAARGQFGGYVGAPQEALNTMLSATGASNMGQQTQTNTRKPGLFDYLSLGCWLAAGSYLPRRRGNNSKWRRHLSSSSPRSSILCGMSCKARKAAPCGCSRLIQTWGRGSMPRCLRKCMSVQVALATR